jgi:hypothetical protein
MVGNRGQGVVVEPVADHHRRLAERHQGQLSRGDPGGVRRPPARAAREVNADSSRIPAESSLVRGELSWRCRAAPLSDTMTRELIATTITGHP